MENVNDSIDVMVFIRTFEPYQAEIRKDECIWYDGCASLEIMPLSTYKTLRIGCIKKTNSFIKEVQLIIPKMNNKTNFHIAYNGYYQ